jgi:hypothetical protein
VFLAPACTYADFAPVVEQRADLWRGFRMFTMTDAAESKDQLVPVVYPRSILYFVSGLLEGEAGTPLVGLARTLYRVRDDDPPAVVAVRRWLLEREDQLVLSPSDSGAGRAAGALKHGDFDDDELVRRSLRELIASGARSSAGTPTAARP